MGGARQRAMQVILGIGMTTRKSGTRKTENGFRLRYGHPLQEQLFGDPEVGDTPVGFGKTLWNLQAIQPALINCYRLDGLVECKINRYRRRGSHGLPIRPYTRHYGAKVRVRERRSPISTAIGCQAGDGVPDLHPGSQSAGQAPLRLLIGESSEPAHVAPVCAGPICLIQASQVATDWSCYLGWQRRDTDTNPGLKMSRTGLNYSTGFVTVVTHGCKYGCLGVIQIDQNMTGVVVQRVGPEIDVKSLLVARAQKSYRRFEQSWVDGQSRSPGSGFLVQ